MEVNKVYNGNCREILKEFPDDSIDSCVTDPPYGLSFMGKKWDYDVPSVDMWREIYRVLKPGAHILVACGTRTQHRMAVNIEDAGFEIRDVITWHYGQGFPKSRDISKAIDDEAGVEREVIGISPAGTGPLKNGHAEKGGGGGFMCEERSPELKVTAPATDAAKEWDGWGTALKPATEFWTLARKLVSENTVASNVLKHATGAINIDACRIEKQPGDREEYGRDTPLDYPHESVALGRFERNTPYIPDEAGRWPANVVLDEFSGISLNRQAGDAARFFYCPKPDSFEKNKGIEKFDKKPGGMRSNTSGQHITRRDGGDPEPVGNFHPTVKPIDLMRYLVRLITPKGGTVLDPFCGSGTTLIGAKLEMKKYIGIELYEEYCKMAEARVAAWNPDLYIPQQLF